MLSLLSIFFFFFQAEDGIRDVAVTGVQTCALPISRAGTAARRPAARRTWTPGTRRSRGPDTPCRRGARRASATGGHAGSRSWQGLEADHVEHRVAEEPGAAGAHARDRKSTRLNSSHGYISYAVFCLKKKK